jgi:hypothetical protein
MQNDRVKIKNRSIPSSRCDALLLEKWGELKKWGKCGIWGKWTGMSFLVDFFRGNEL